MHKLEVSQEALAVLESGVKIVTFRRAAGSFFGAFGDFIKQHPIKKVIAMTQSESDGAITLTIAYKPVDSDD